MAFSAMNGSRYVNPTNHQIKSTIKSNVPCVRYSRQNGKAGRQTIHRYVNHETCFRVHMAGGITQANQTMV